MVRVGLEATGRTGRTGKMSMKKIMVGIVRCAHLLLILVLVVERLPRNLNSFAMLRKSPFSGKYIFCYLHIVKTDYVH